MAPDIPLHTITTSRTFATGPGFQIFSLPDFSIFLGNPAVLCSKRLVVQT
jgi:hypothetical protein